MTNFHPLVSTMTLYNYHAPARKQHVPFPLALPEPLPHIALASD
jgi:hypothetical protein